MHGVNSMLERTKIFWDIDLGNYRIMKASVHSFATVFCGHHIVTP